MPQDDLSVIEVDYFCEVCMRVGHLTDYGYFCDEHDPGEPTYD